jgi:ATP-binding cassette subfamily A (ABC1) protein 3
MKNLTKTFGDFKAVDDLSLEIKESEVFCMLGHNGAGKTTAIYMLTGVLRPTSGDAKVYGNYLTKDLD